MLVLSVPCHREFEDFCAQIRWEIFNECFFAMLRVSLKSCPEEECAFDHFGVTAGNSCEDKRPGKVSLD